MSTESGRGATLSRSSATHDYPNFSVSSSYGLRGIARTVPLHALGGLASIQTEKGLILDGKVYGQYSAGDARSLHRGTYLNLRLGLFVMIALLLISILLQFAQSCPHWQTSISAYYYTGAHAAFIGALCAMGALLMVYKGSSTTEDVLLNNAGYLAFIVAFAPTGYPGSTFGPGALPRPPTYAPAAGVDTTVMSVFIIGALTWGLWFVLVAYKKLRRQSEPKARPLKFVLYFARGSGIITVGALGALFFFWPEVFYKYGHMAAAITLFVS